MSNNEVKVWDILVRIFHWSLVVSFTVAYLIEDDIMDVHLVAGYTVFGLILFRIVWGFVGSEHARFRDFLYQPDEIKQFVKDTFSFKAKRYLGHNPAGGLMVYIMLLGLLITTLSGMIYYGMDEWAGPFYFLAGSPEIIEEAMEEIHEFSANLMVLLIVIHISGVIVESLLNRENLVRAMITGKKPVEHDE